MVQFYIVHILQMSGSDIFGKSEKGRDWKQFGNHWDKRMVIKSPLWPDRSRVPPTLHKSSYWWCNPGRLQSNWRSIQRAPSLPAERRTGSCLWKINTSLVTECWARTRHLWKVYKSLTYNRALDSDPSTMESKQVTYERTLDSDSWPPPVFPLQ